MVRQEEKWDEKAYLFAKCVRAESHEAGLVAGHAWLLLRSVARGLQRACDCSLEERLKLRFPLLNKREVPR